MKKVIITDKIPFQNVELTVKLKEYAAMVGPAENYADVELEALEDLILHKSSSITDKFNLTDAVRYELKMKIRVLAEKVWISYKEPYGSVAVDLPEFNSVIICRASETDVTLTVIPKVMVMTSK